MGKTKAPPVILCDFETEAIAPRPHYPPKPVSLALKWPDRKDWILMAWGHHDHATGSREGFGNNCTEREARAEYAKARNSRYRMCFQNGMFDQDVAEEHWQFPLLPWERFDDTMFLLFLWDPHAPTLSLKPSAERYLGMPPEEQDRMYDWIIEHIPEARRKPSTAGAYIANCPYQIVKPYHKGDLVRTGGIFEYLWPRVIDAGMGAAYDRERRLMPILLRNARRGIRLDVAALERDAPQMRAGLEKMDAWLRRRLGDINLDSPKQLGDALYEKDVVTEFKMTAGGNGAAPQRSVSKKHLTIDRFADRRVYQALTYRGQMETSLSMFVEPWMELASASPDGATLYPNWSQVRSPKNGGTDTGGARSGRIICSKPNFLNIPKKWKKAISAGYVHPTFVKVPELPFMRKYVLPHKGKRWGRRDYNQQEVRLFAHYEEGPVMEGFLRDPRFDMHEGVRAAEEEALIAAGLREEFGRDDAKITVFGKFYGQGLDGLMEALKIPEEQRVVGRTIQSALDRAAPSIKELSDELKARAKDGLPIMTWGGRLYYCEPPQYSKKYNRDMTFEYKLISYLIQGSGADVIKEALVRYDEHPGRGENLNVTVYDEIDIDLPMSERGARHEMTVLRDVMQSIECDVPMLSDGEIGPNWGTLEKYAI